MVRVPKAQIARLEKAKKFLDKVVGYTKYPDPRVHKFMTLMDPVNKNTLQSELFGPKTMGRNYIIKDKASSTNLMKRKSELYENIRRSYINEGSKPTPRDANMPFHHLNYLFGVKTLQNSQDYSEMLAEHSIMLLVNDRSDTLTDVNYEREIQAPIRKLETVPKSIKFKNVSMKKFLDLINDDEILSKVVQGIEIHPTLKQLRIEPILKVILIPTHSVHLTAQIIEELQKYDSKYELFSVYINMERSSQLAEEFVEVLKNFNSKNQPTSYETLLQIAIDSKSTKNQVTKELLTTIGKNNLLKVGITDKSITFTTNVKRKQKFSSKSLKI